ncbi:MAG: Na+/H+ antiporter NhaC [Elusimicrobia bacterium CG08_land_8_20_14_0_20_59_10]|nr:MAG: Na+/H+ antiporter NhaC [Elusimicrobia bacterium CG08_land_8_20_14_0_20_59_10]
MTSSRPAVIKLYTALVPVLAVVVMLAYNVGVYGDNAVGGSNQFILLLAGVIAALIGFRNKVPYSVMLDHVSSNLKTTTGAILILLMVGALSGAWLISGIIPSMIYYGLKILNPFIFLPATLLICSVVSLATGSSWSTSATVGIALIGIGKAIGVPEAMAAGAVISGAYFGDKLSPLSDTTNLAPAMAGTDLFTHIRYMTITTIPSYTVTLLAFIIMGFTVTPHGAANVGGVFSAIESVFTVTPWLFLVPAIVIFMIVRKTQPLVALVIGTLLGGAFALIFQPQVVAKLAGVEKLDFTSAYTGVMNALTVKTSIATPDPALNDLFSSKGMKGMLDTIWLIICAMCFGGVMEAIGALHKISSTLLKAANSVFGLFASTVASCLAVNLTASDQYLAIVVPGRMFAEPFRDKGLAPENLSRTLEDSGTVTSALIPWNTCGAYQAGVLGVGTLSYLPYAVFNYVSPVMTLIFAAFMIKIKKLPVK